MSQGQSPMFENRTQRLKRTQRSQNSNRGEICFSLKKPVE